MNKNELKKFVTKILLEKLKQSPKVEGKLVKKTLSFRGIEREHVCEGTIEQANEYAIQHNLVFTIEENSSFGGHFTGELASFEFHPNPEFYGELMETSMSAREQLSRICGTNDQVLTEVDAQNAEKLVEFICTNESFLEEKTNMVFEQIKGNIDGRLYDKTQFTKLFEYLVKQSCTAYTKDKIELSESELEYTTKLLSKRFFENHDTQEELEEKTNCGKKSFKTGNAFENMQRIKSGHQMFL
jgi:hypothetical protein